MKDAFIVDGVRTAIGKFGGAFAGTRADDMAAHVIKSLVEKQSSLDPSQIDDVILGNANGAGEENRNVARMSLLLAGLPVTVPGETVNRLCASGMSAVISASRAIRSGDNDILIAGGVENMTRAPFVQSKAESAFSRDVQIFDTTMGWRFVNPKLKEMYGVDAMGETAENVAELYKIDRESQDKFAFNSQQKAGISIQNGIFNREIVSYSIPQKKGDPIIFNNDEFAKPETTMEILAKLRPAFRQGGTVTAATSSGINDGAAALLIASEDGIKRNNLKPMARIVASGISGVKPSIMGIGPVEAANKALAKAGLTFADIDIIELNEAFAAQGLACIRQWGLADDDARINPNGGAIALGHPLGMSGARLVLTAAYELTQRNLKYALCTMCIGVGQGYAVIIERV